MELFGLDTLLACVKQACAFLLVREQKGVLEPTEGGCDKTMRATVPSRLSAGHVLSLGMFCGLLLIPLSSFLFRSLIQAFRRKRKTSLPSAAPYPVVRTERGAIIHVSPSPLGKREREAVRLSIVLHEEARHDLTGRQRRKSPRPGRLARLPERQGIPC